jgi:hypothetical protein
MVEQHMSKMEICICGWHYHQPFYEKITKAKDKFNMTVVAHREGPQLGIRTIMRPNIGLDWGSYDFFLKNCWYGATDVLFIQDDTEIDDMEELNRISSIPCDQVFLFSDEEEAAYNSYGHGRAFFCSRDFLFEIIKDGGVYYDKGNTGYIAPGHFLATQPPPGCRHHNAGIHAFMKQIEQIKTALPSLEVFGALYTPGLRFGRRGGF